jgi:hypothetical protein
MDDLFDAFEEDQTQLNKKTDRNEKEQVLSKKVKKPKV